MSSRSFRFLVLVVLVGLLMGSVSSVLFAQDDPIVTNTPGGGTVIVDTPPADLTAVPTADSPDNPRGSLTISDWVEFIKPILIIGLIAIILLFGTSLFFAYQHIPSWARPIVTGGINSGFATLRESARLTPYDWDDKLYEYADEAWLKWKADADAKLNMVVSQAYNSKPSTSPPIKFNYEAGSFKDDEPYSPPVSSN